MYGLGAAVIGVIVVLGVYDAIKKAAQAGF